MYISFILFLFSKYNFIHFKTLISNKEKISGIHTNKESNNTKPIHRDNSYSTLTLSDPLEYKILLWECF